VNKNKTKEENFIPSVKDETTEDLLGILLRIRLLVTASISLLFDGFFEEKTEGLILAFKFLLLRARL